jgi:hypothetical protein
VLDDVVAMSANVVRTFIQRPSTGTIAPTELRELLFLPFENGRAFSQMPG